MSIPAPAAARLANALHDFAALQLPTRNNAVSLSRILDIGQTIFAAMNGVREEIIRLAEVHGADDIRLWMEDGESFAQIAADGFRMTVQAALDACDDVAMIDATNADYRNDMTREAAE